MIERVIDITETAVHLSTKGALLAVTKKDADTLKPRPRGARAHDPANPPPAETTIPFEEIAAVVAAHPHITFSRAAVSDLAAAGAILVVCDDRFTPSAMMLPLAANFIQTERFAAQAAAQLPVKKRAWQKIIKAKVRAQARLLREVRGKDFRLASLAERVKSGDSDGIEAQAARAYWPALFNNPQFRRHRDGGGPNIFLNYGYTILRAITARAVCAAGLHPSLGLHHHNRYDTFCLASDLMEPFRPIVDRASINLYWEMDLEPALDSNARATLIRSLTDTRILYKKEERTIFDVLNKIAFSLVEVFAGKRKNISLPERFI